MGPFVFGDLCSETIQLFRLKLRLRLRVTFRVTFRVTIRIRLTVRVRVRTRLTGQPCISHPSL